MAADSFDVSDLATDVARFLAMKTLRFRVARLSAAFAECAREGLRLRYPRTRCPSPCPLLLLLRLLVHVVHVRVLVVRRPTVWHHQ